jgi:hypothetical protein
MFNDMMKMLSDIPLTLAAAWTVWFGAGALLAVWYRRAQANLEMQPAVVTRTVVRAKSGIRPTVSAEPRAMAEPRISTPKVFGDLSPVAAPRSKPAPIVVGDPFGDLATLLDQPAAETPAPAFRTPVESPILNSAGSPVLRNNDPEPKY